MDPFSAAGAPRPRAARKAEFAQFHQDNHPTLVALMHALRGDRPHALRVTRRAFALTWLRWQSVRTLPDPVTWTRRAARRTPPPPRRRWTGAEADGAWVAHGALPTYRALRGLPDDLRTVLALHHIARLDHEAIADEEYLSPETVTERLGEAHRTLAERMAFTGLDDNPALAAATEIWAGRALADLAHALSYRTDRQGVDQVFRDALRHRARLVAATAAVVSVGGLGGALAVTHYVPTAPNVVPPAGGSPLRPPSQPERDRALPPQAAGAPPVPGSEGLPGRDASDPVGGGAGSTDRAALGPVEARTVTNRPVRNLAVDLPDSSTTPLLGGGSDGRSGVRPVQLGATRQAPERYRSSGDTAAVPAAQPVPRARRAATDTSRVATSPPSRDRVQAASPGTDRREAGGSKYRSGGRPDGGQASARQGGERRSGVGRWNGRDFGKRDGGSRSRAEGRGEGGSPGHGGGKYSRGGGRTADSDGGSRSHAKRGGDSRSHARSSGGSSRSHATSGGSKGGSHGKSGGHGKGGGSKGGGSKGGGGKGGGGKGGGKGGGRH